MHRTYMICLLVLLAATGNAQWDFSRDVWGKSSNSKKKERVRWQNWRADTDSGRLYIRTNPVGPLEFLDQNFSLGAEYRITPSVSVIMDAGYIYYSLYTGKVKSASGVVLRPAIRVYAGKRKDFFITAQFHYKEVNYQVENWLNRAVVNDVPSYEEYKRFRFYKQVFGGHILFGGKEYLSRNHRWLLEVYVGIGIRFKKEGLPNEPGSTQFMAPNRWANWGENDDWSSGVYDRVLPALPAGIRILYQLF